MSTLDEKLRKMLIDPSDYGSEEHLQEDIALLKQAFLDAGWTPPAPRPTYDFTDGDWSANR